VSSSLALSATRSAEELIVLCERRIGRPVDAAARIRVRTASGTRILALAVADGWLWWLDAHPRRSRVGRIVLYQPLDGLSMYTETRRRGRHWVELSAPATGELFLGLIYGPGAERLVGQITAEQFAHAQTCIRPGEETHE
jgi:hypothetical protein